jgi:hypothetical protein
MPVINQEVRAVLDDLLINVLSQAAPEDRIDEMSVEHVFDYDGCLGDYDGEDIPEEMQAADQQFWQDLKDEIHEQTKGLPSDRRCISIGTARQSKECDDLGIAVNHSPSCFIIYDERALFLDVIFDPFLLADVKDGLLPGTSYQYIMDPMYQGSHATWYFDESKISLIYAKAHRAASFNPYGTVQLTFYDDRQDILDGLYDFFTSNAALLPDNLALYLCQYRRGQGILYSYPDIYGISVQDSLGIDFEYENTVRELGIYIHQASFQRGLSRPLHIPEIQALGLEQIIHDLRCTDTVTTQLGHMIFTPPSDTVNIDDIEETESIEDIEDAGECESMYPST